MRALLLTPLLPKLEYFQIQIQIQDSLLSLIAHW